MTATSASLSKVNTASLNGYQTVEEIRAQAKRSSADILHGRPSALGCLNQARKLTEEAQLFEGKGELPAALRKYIQAASLFSYVINHHDLKLETQSGKHGALYNEVMAFNSTAMEVITSHMKKVEASLKEVESHREESIVLRSPDVEQRPGGSIADRMKSLQEAGMTFGSVQKRGGREARGTLPSSPHDVGSDGHEGRPSSVHLGHSPKLPSSLGLSEVSQPRNSVTSTSSSIPSPLSSPPISLPPQSFAPQKTPVNQIPSLPSSPISKPLNLASNSTTTYSTSAQVTAGDGHTSPSSNGLNSFHIPTLSEFEQSFPTVSDLDESFTLPSPPLNLPSVPSGKVGAPRSQLPPPPTLHREDFSVQPPEEGFSFPSPPLGATQRPSSTPVHAVNALSPQTTPQSPNVPIPPGSPRKQAYLSQPVGPRGPRSPRPDLSVSSKIDPRSLRQYMSQGYSVLILDARPREEFERLRIKSDAVVCIDPTVLARQDVSSVQIEDSLVISPQSEQCLFTNRRQFDLIVLVDATSASLLHSPLCALHSAIYINEFRSDKILKKPPTLLAGGILAWLKEFGEEETVSSAQEPEIAENRHSHAVPSTPPPPPSYENDVLSPTILASVESHATQDMQRPHHSKEAAFARLSLDSPPEATGPPIPIGHREEQPEPDRRLARKPAMVRPTSSTQLSSYNRNGGDALSFSNSPIQYPQRVLSSQPALNASYRPPSQLPPPVTSMTGRRTDYLEQSQHAYSGSQTIRPIDYPQLQAAPPIRPPPAVASHALERQDHRPRVVPDQPYSSMKMSAPQAPTIPSDYPVMYWPDAQVGVSGLKNLGNTCYMNSIIQCLSATVPFARFFTDGRWRSAINMLNPLGTKGNLAGAFAKILHEMWQGEYTYLSPYTFRKSITAHAPQFAGTDQHDSQEFLSFLLDGLHEDLNRILNKPPADVMTPERESALETLPQQIASQHEWKLYQMRNNSLIVDYFQGQFRNRLQCLTCRKTSTTYSAFMYLSLPVPSSRGAVTLYQCLDAFVKEEVMEKADAWKCPNCKTLRKATMQLSLSRLPPVLLIHLKRFSFKGPFTDKLETVVDFPLRGLDLTNYMPPLLPPGADKSALYGGQVPRKDDPRTQIPPYRYDLYGVTNHFGSLTSGHYTSFIASKREWLYCDDSRVTIADPRRIVDKPAYILFYKRVPY